MDDLINVSNIQEDVSEDGDLMNDSQQPEVVSDNEEMLEQSNNQAEPLVIETRGVWQPFEAEANVSFVEGHTYQINVNGICEFATGVNRPSSGLRINSFTYTKGKDNRLWIKTN